jgi:putative ABC transport system ATP-binding protein
MEIDKSQPLVETRAISKHFGKDEARVDALREVSIQVHPGEVVGLLGPSGSGKTTLLNVIGCIVEPNFGWMSLDGEVVYDGGWLRSDLRRLRLEKIGFIFQFHNLLPFLSCLDNVAIVLSLAGLSPLEAKRRAVELLEYLEVGHRKDAFPAQLSGGEAQRVAIARALANRPRIILADEPTAALHDEKIYDRLDRIFDLRDGRLGTDREAVTSGAA